MSVGLKIYKRLFDDKNIGEVFGNNLLKMYKIPEIKIFKCIKYNKQRMYDKYDYDLVFWLIDDVRGDLFHKVIAIKKDQDDYFDIEKDI
ncbi:hypothetical protein IDZ49_10940 [Francisella tularensis]|nr:hypothetical protein [Francisella tularensis]